jgi:hypothetical protein
VVSGNLACWLVLEVRVRELMTRLKAAFSGCKAPRARARNALDCEAAATNGVGFRAGPSSWTTHVTPSLQGWQGSFTSPTKKKISVWFVRQVALGDRFEKKLLSSFNNIKNFAGASQSSRPPDGRESSTLITAEINSISIFPTTHISFPLSSIHHDCQKPTIWPISPHGIAHLCTVHAS